MGAMRVAGPGSSRAPIEARAGTHDAGLIAATDARRDDGALGDARELLVEGPHKAIGIEFHRRGRDRADRQDTKAGCVRATALRHLRRLREEGSLAVQADAEGRHVRDVFGPSHGVAREEAAADRVRSTAQAQGAAQARAIPRVPVGRSAIATWTRSHSAKPQGADGIEPEARANWRPKLPHHRDTLPEIGSLIIS